MQFGNTTSKAINNLSHYAAMLENYRSSIRTSTVSLGMAGL
jgi:hypothetical protein